MKITLVQEKLIISKNEDNFVADRSMNLVNWNANVINEYDNNGEQFVKLFRNGEVLQLIFK